MLLLGPLWNRVATVKNPAFIYHRPVGLDETLSLLADVGHDAKILAGGQSLLPTMALRLGPPEQLIDISRVPGLDGISVSATGEVTVGALVRHATVEHSADVGRYAPLVAETMPYIGHRAIRNRGTLVGSIAHADPAAELPAVCLALNATLRAVSTDGTRDIPAAEFFEGYLQTALKPNELLQQVTFPAWPSTSGGALVEVSRRHGDYALVGLACALDVRDGVVASASLAFFSVGSTAQRVSEAEAHLVGSEPSAELFARAAEVVSEALNPAPDVHGTTAYRKHLAGVLTERGLSQATAAIGVPA